MSEVNQQPKSVKPKMPKIRFEGFSEDLTSMEFREFTKLSQGLQISIDKRFLEPGDNRVFYITNEFLNPNSNKRYYIENPPKSVIANVEDILMTRTGNTGKVVTNVSGAYHNNFFKIAYDKTVDKRYLYYLLNEPRIQSEILARAGSSTIPDLNHSDFYSLKGMYPNKEEQTQIGNFFQELDKLIELQTRTVELAETHKKAMLQKMFPQKGEKAPKVRFEGFSGDWNEKKLKEIVSFSKGKGYSKSSLVDEGNPIILYGSLYTDYKSNINNVTTFAIPIENSIYSEGNEIILPSSGESDVDIARASAVTQKGVLLGGDLNVLKPKQDLNNIFMALNLTYSSVNSSLVKRAQGQVVVHLYNSDIQNLKISYPSIEEQTKLGHYFQELDRNIETEKQKLEQYQTMKRAMLQRMFV